MTSQIELLPKLEKMYFINNKYELYISLHTQG